MAMISRGRTLTSVPLLPGCPPASCVFCWPTCITRLTAQISTTCRPFTLPRPQAGTAGAAAAEHTTAANHVSSSPPLGGRAPLSFSGAQQGLGAAPPASSRPPAAPAASNSNPSSGSSSGGSPHASSLPSSPAGAGGVLFAGSAWARGLHPAAGAGVSAAQPFETGMPAPPAQAQLQ